MECSLSLFWESSSSVGSFRALMKAFSQAAQMEREKERNRFEERIQVC